MYVVSQLFVDEAKTDNVETDGRLYTNKTFSNLFS
jgi:hypothetical protein